MENGHLRHISDQLTLSALAYEPADILVVSAQQLASYPLDLPLTRWVSGHTDKTLYFLQHGTRYKIPDLATLYATGGSESTVALLPDDYLHSFPGTDEPISGIGGIEKNPSPLQDVVWFQNALFISRAQQPLTRWEPKTGKSQPVSVAINRLSASKTTLYGVTTEGAIWDLTGEPSLLPGASGNHISAINSSTWYADANSHDFATGAYHIGRGLIRRDSAGNEQNYSLNSEPDDPLKNITALVLDNARQKLWVGSWASGLLVLDLAQSTWEHYSTLNSAIPDDLINALALAPDGSLWLATPAGLGHFRQGKFENYPVPGDVTDKGVRALAVNSDNGVWAAGSNFIGHFTSGGTWEIHSALENPQLIDSFVAVVLDNDQFPWFVGERHMLHWDSSAWTAYDTATFQPVALDLNTPPQLPQVISPAPQTDYQNWLKAWPRPAGDNGWGMHYLAFPSDDPLELQQQIERLHRLNIHWLLVNYTSRAQLPIMAQAFTRAGIMVIWRPFVRPYEHYAYWAQDVTFLRAFGIPPYIQVYNEPSLGQEWEDQGKSVDQALYLANLLPAMRQVYDAGGYVGLQEIDLEWLRAVLRQMKSLGAQDIFQRLFFVPHAYGFNHPPEFDKDPNGVLGFRDFAQVFQDEIGFVPIMVAGEGGWRPGEAQDAQYPMVTTTLQRDYYLALFGWFRQGRLSNGEPLPDYLFAFCPWLLADSNDPAAWYDSRAGARELLIQAVSGLPHFERQFSWDKGSTF